MRAILLFVPVLAAGLAAAPQPYDPFAEAKHAPVNGTTLAYVERGSGGTPLVFVHGSGADLRTWGYQLQFFAATRRTLTYSRRFHHPNPPPEPGTPYVPAQHAADLAGFIDRVAGGRADVVAASYGGVVALMTARDTPAVIRRLVIVEPVTFALLDAGSPEARATAPLDLARRQLLDGDEELAMRTFVSAIIAPGAYELMPPTTRAMLRDNLPELTAEARAPLVTTEARYTCDDVRRAAAPTLVLEGSASAPFLRAMARKVLECLPHGESHTIAGVAHAAHAQQAQAFNGVVQAFLDRE